MKQPREYKQSAANTAKNQLLLEKVLGKMLQEEGPKT